MNRLIEILEKARKEILTPERPSFGPSQILKIEDIQIGKKYIKNGAYKQELIFLRPSIKKEDGEWWVRIVTPTEEKEIYKLEEICLADCGVVPYADGQWNKFNWLEDPTKKKEASTAV